MGARQTQGYKGQGKKGMPEGHNQDCSFRFGNGPFWLVQYPIENLSQGEPAPTLGTFTFLSKVFYSSHVTQEMLKLDLETLIWFRNMLLGINRLGTIDNVMNIHWALVGTWRHPIEYIWEHQISKKSHPHPPLVPPKKGNWASWVQVVSTHSLAHKGFYFWLSRSPFLA